MKPWACRAAFALAAVLISTGCSGNGSLPASASHGAAVAPDAKKATLRITVVIPKEKRRRRARWVSPSTKSIAIALASAAGGAFVVNVTINLPASPGCTTTGSGTTCSATVSVAPGSYFATIKTFDAIDRGGSELSLGEGLPVTVTAGQANNLPLTIGGIPHSLTILGSTVALRGNQSAGFVLYTAATQALIVTAKDADGNTIVGAGTPWTGSVVSGSGWAIQAKPAPAEPDELVVTPPGTNGSTATLKIEANYGSSTCSQTGVVCSVTFAIKNDVQFLAVVNCNVSCGYPPMTTLPDAVKVYKLPNTTTPVATVTNGVSSPNTVAFDASGKLFVSNCKTSCGGTGADTITVYAPPYTGTPVTITTGVNFVTLMTVDPAGDLFVNSCQNCNFELNDYVVEYPHANLTTATPTTIAPGGQINALATDPAGDLLIANCQMTCGYAVADAVVQYPAPFTGSGTILTAGIADPTAIALDASGNMFVGNCATCATTTTFSITRYAVPYSAGTNPTLTITGGGSGVAPYVDTPLSLALDSAKNLFVGNGPGGATNQNVAEFPAPAYGGNGTRLLMGYQPYEVRIDGLNDLFVSDSDSLQVSAPPYSTKTQIGTPEGIFSDNGFAISP